ncbi:MAG: heavy-metal-associated domain-containing protein, partial [Chitinophagia bacterium]|nr:heavy-metal-associated domain-containing protein [Chitinophagia bacterium]
METLKRTIPVTGMTCAACSLSVEKLLHTQKGVVNAAVNYANGQALVEYKPGTADFKAMEQAV